MPYIQYTYPEAIFLHLINLLTPYRIQDANCSLSRRKSLINILPTSPYVIARHQLHIDPYLASSAISFAIRSYYRSALRIRSQMLTITIHWPLMLYIRHACSEATYSSLIRFYKLAGSSQERVQIYIYIAIRIQEQLQATTRFCRRDMFLPVALYLLASLQTTATHLTPTISKLYRIWLSHVAKQVEYHYFYCLPFAARILYSFQNFDFSILTNIVYHPSILAYLLISRYLSSLTIDHLIPQSH